VRVIAGSARGRPLRAATSTRPTADLIKGVIFSMLEALAYKRGFEPDEDGNLAAAVAWPRVLDLYAGSGALGIEALSRGAAFATFVEQDRAAARIISANLANIGLSHNARLIVAPIRSALASVESPIDLVFADPPYAETIALAATADLLGSLSLLKQSSVVVLEHPSSTQAPPTIGPVEVVSTRKHGRTSVTLYAASGVLT
jgi:16S rRNA (guanine966-N2)-methyltransferase